MGFCSPLAKFKSQTLQLNVLINLEGQAEISTFALLGSDIFGCIGLP